ncbi:MAG: MarR family winged helix-turn-helix transcriptional regulator [Acidimicrobiia bacterium]
MGTAIREYQRANDAFDEAVMVRMDLNRTDGRCIDLLQERRRLSAGELAQATGLTTGAVTAVIDRLEKAGWARRVRDDADRRRVLVEPTERTDLLCEQIFGPLMTEGNQYLEGLSVEQLQAIIGFLRHSTDASLRHAVSVVGVPPGRHPIDNLAANI